jgi:ABC-type lipoprotein release transport system permease subunit
MRARLNLYALLCAAHFRRHRVRLSFTTTGITIGVASVIAILTINRSTYSSFQSTVAVLAGRAQIEIANGAAGVPEELVTELEIVPGVAAIAGVVQEFVRIPSLNGRQVCLLGVDLLQHSAMWEGEFEKKGWVSSVRRTS